jgi:hypothetical protein
MKGRNMSLIGRYLISKEYKRLLEFHKNDKNCEKCIYWINDCYYGQKCTAFEKFKASHEKA